MFLPPYKTWLKVEGRLSGKLYITYSRNLYPLTLRLLTASRLEKQIPVIPFTVLIGY